MAKWRRLLLPAALLAVVIALGLWYTRPLDLYGLGLEQTPDDISVTIRRSEGGTADSAQRSLRLVRREAGFDSLLQQLEGLSFRSYGGADWRGCLCAASGHPLPERVAGNLNDS